ncbi:ribonuclease HII [Woodsholea maritima]|uniref:ribonuclease HII n=1 Tax=Woodsholea maritima TaxID=240237 RepID=UPI0003761634|nr:ribonuclease HII [Woodsholea maritima]
MDGFDDFAGIDEAGRGPLAGPVVAAAVILPQDLSELQGLGDSKALSEKKRAALAPLIYRHALVGVGIAEPEEIDRLNILHATMIAMVRAVEHLPRRPVKILVDGNRLPPIDIPGEAIVGGDAKIAAIGAASIIAKTLRDEILCAAEKRFTGFGLAKHKGYPAPVHRKILTEQGPTPIHRFSYAPVRHLCESIRP